MVISCCDIYIFLKFVRYKNYPIKSTVMAETLEISEVYKAAQVLRDVARHPRLIGVPKINPDSEVYLKPENLQHTGAFKLRGAYYKISQLTPEEKAHGVIACSAGNHAQGVALAATRNGIKSLICLPAGAPISKIEATKRLGAEVCLVPGVYDDAYQKAIELQKEHNYTFIHPFDDLKVIAGQGTIALEILEEMPDVEAVIVPIGGGGLIAGIAFTLKQLKPDVKVYGVQAEGAPSMYKSVRDGEIERLDKVATIADAILALIEQQKLVAEGAGAVSVAAAMFNKVPIKGKKTVCVVSGGNIDVTILNRVITRGLVKSGRNCTLTLDLTDQPGQLSGVCHVLGENGANIISVTHERNSHVTSINGCLIRIEIETRNNEHIGILRKALTDEGYHIVGQTV